MTELRRGLLCCFACALVVLVAALVSPLRAQGKDTLPGRLGAVALTCNGTLNLRAIDWLAAMVDRGETAYYLRPAPDAAQFSIFGPGPALLGAPAMLRLQPGALISDKMLRRRARYSAAGAVALSTGLLAAGLLAAGSRRRAAAGALTAGLSFAGAATLAQGLWQQTAALPFLCAALASVAWGARLPRLLLATPTLLLVAVFLRPPSIGVGAGLALGWLFAMRAVPREQRVRLAAVSIAGATLAALPLLAWNLRALGSLFPVGQYQLAARLVGGASAFSLAPGKLLPAAAALLVSPGRGLLFFAPIVPFALVVASRHRVNSRSAVALGLVAQILVAAGYHYWWGGISFGPRFVIESVWIAAWVAWTEAALRSRVEQWLRWGVSLACVAVGLLGLWRWDPRLWELRRDLDHHAAEIVWDLADSPIAAMLTAPQPSQPLLDAPAGPFFYCRPNALSLTVVFQKP